MWKHYLKGAEAALATAIGDRRYGRRYNRQAVESLRGVLPYCLHPASFGDSSTLIWLNRDYKPLGVFAGYGRVNYMEFPWLHVDRESQDISALLKKCKVVSGALCGGEKIYYLYSDRISPEVSKGTATMLLCLIQMALGLNDVDDVVEDMTMARKLTGV